MDGMNNAWGFEMRYGWVISLIVLVVMFIQRIVFLKQVQQFLNLLCTAKQMKGGRLFLRGKQRNLFFQQALSLFAFGRPCFIILF